LDHRTISASGHRVWTFRMENALTGFSHGAAGICLALVRLFEHTGDQEFLDAAREAIDFETFHYSRQKKNWPDLRETIVKKKGSPAFVSKWCHGAPGIGLSRLLTLSSLDHDGMSMRMSTHIENSLSATLACSIEGADHLCCGNFGRLEFLQEA